MKNFSNLSEQVIDLTPVQVYLDLSGETRVGFRAGHPRVIPLDPFAEPLSTGRPFLIEALVLPGPPTPSPLSIGIEWASRIVTIGLGFALPAFLGHFVDTRFGMGHVGLLIGMILGFVVGMISVLRLARQANKH